MEIVDLPNILFLIFQKKIVSLTSVRLFGPKHLMLKCRNFEETQTTIEPKMRYLYSLLFLSFLITLSCGKPAGQVENDEPEEEMAEDPNQALYEQVMEIHDEVMPKMEDIYKIKSQLQEQIANSPDMVVGKREKIEKMIKELDSANNLMMDWMHQFNPLPDSADEQESRAYLESQMQKIRAVKEGMLLTLEMAKEPTN